MYCVKPDGTCSAANKANAVVANATACTAQNTATNALSVTTMNAASFDAGDTVYFSGLNTSLVPTNYGSVRIVIPSSGSDSNNLVTYQGLTDGAGVNGYPVIVMTGATGGFYDGAKSYVSVSNFDFEYGGTTSTVQHFYLAGSNETISNITINGNSYGYGIYAPAGVNFSNVTLSNITISNLTYYSVFVGTGTNSGLTISNLTTSSGRGMSITGVSGVTLTNVTSNATTSDFDSLTITGASGVVSISNYHSANSGHIALSIWNSTPTSLSITNPVITGATYTRAFYLKNVDSSSIQILNGSIHDNLGTGMYIDQSPNTVIKGFNPFNITNGGIYNNGGTTNNQSGISVSNAAGNSNNMIIADNWIYNNGVANALPGGNCDGIDIHASSSNIAVYDNIVVNNGNSGFAFVLDSSGVAYNNVLVHNGTAAVSTTRGGYYNSGSGAWTLKNNIFLDNYPYEMNVTSAIPTSNYNLFYHTADSNLFHNMAIPANYSLATWRSTYSQDLGSLNTNPLFTDGSGNYSLPSDFHLQNTSPAINAGTNVGLTSDFVGNPVPSGPAPDIGAYEFQDSTAPATTASPAHGTYNATQLVTLSCSDGAGVGCDPAKTYYTTDGSDPATSGTRIQYSYTPTPAVITISSSETLRFYSTDKSNNAEMPKSEAYTIDTTPSDTIIDTEPSNPAGSTSAAFTFHATESSSFQCKIDSDSYSSCTSPKNYNGLSEGPHTFYVKATDTAGNEDPSPASFTWTIDTAAPDTTINSHPVNPTNSTSANFTFSSSESNSTFQCKIDSGSYADCTSPQSYSSLSSTSHTFSVKATDQAGNEDPSPASFTWTIDTTAPLLSEVAPVSTPTNDQTSSYTFHTNEAGVISYGGGCTSGDTATLSGNKTVIFNTLSEGSYGACTITVTDAAGNASLPLTLSTFIVDTTPPTSTASPHGGTYGATQNVTLTCSDGSGGGCDKIYYTINGDDPDVSSSVYSSPLSIGADTTLKFFAKDKAGNAESPFNTETYTIDTSYPVTDITSKPASYSNSDSATFVFHANKTSTFQCQLDSGTFADCTSPEAYSALSEGAHTFTVKATDMLGHQEEPTPPSYSWTVDTTAPHTSISSHPNDSTNATTASFTFSANESSTFKCKLDSGSYSTCATPKDYAGLSEGSHTFSVKATDLAGNEDPSPVSFTFTVDTTAPNISVTGPVDTPTNDVTPSYRFNSSENGTISYDGSCGTGNATAVSGDNIAIWGILLEGSYSDCRLRVTDPAGNQSNWLSINPFVIDTTPPTILGASPSGELPAGTLAATLTVDTNEDSICRYSTTPGTGFALMPHEFDTTGNTTHTQAITGLSSGADYRYYARCQDLADNLMTSDYTISFSIASAPSVSSDSHHSDHHKKKTVKKRNIKNTFSKVTNGGTINPTGKHFSKSNTVLLYFSKSNGVFYLYKRVPTDSKGNFSISLYVNKPRGFYGWYAVDQKTGKKSNVRHYTVK